jgi:hypothetical protein
MNYQTEPVTMWSDHRLVMRKSPIHNIGTFATHDINPGELLIMVTGGLIVTAEDRQSGGVQLAAELYNEETLHAAQIHPVRGDAADPGWRGDHGRLL